MDLNAQLLQQIITREGTSLPSEMQRMLSQMLGGSAADGTVIEATAEDVTPDQSQDDIDLDRWRQEAERNERILDAVTAKLEMLACAVGACPNCWGADGPCTGCGGHGRGRPGKFLPDPDCFDTFVAPVLRAMVDESAPLRQGPKVGATGNRALAWAQRPRRSADTKLLPPQTRTETKDV